MIHLSFSIIAVKVVIELIKQESVSCLFKVYSNYTIKNPGAKQNMHFPLIATYLIAVSLKTIYEIIFLAAYLWRDSAFNILQGSEICRLLTFL